MSRRAIVTRIAPEVPVRVALGGIGITRTIVGEVEMPVVVVVGVDRIDEPVAVAVSSVRSHGAGSDAGRTGNFEP